MDPAPSMLPVTTEVDTSITLAVVEEETMDKAPVDNSRLPAATVRPPVTARAPPAARLPTLAPPDTVARPAAETYTRTKHTHTHSTAHSVVRVRGATATEAAVALMAHRHERVGALRE